MYLWCLILENIYLFNCTPSFYLNAFILHGYFSFTHEVDSPIYDGPVGPPKRTPWTGSFLCFQRQSKVRHVHKAFTMQKCRNTVDSLLFNAILKPCFYMYLYLTVLNYNVYDIVMYVWRSWFYIFAILLQTVELWN